MYPRHVKFSLPKRAQSGPCLVIAACLSVAACGYQTLPPDTARAPQGAFGSNGDEDVAAINLASWAFSYSGNTRGRPVVAARSVAAVDYLAGELNSNPRWTALSPLVQMEMLQARDEVRATLGVAPGTRSQFVVDSLTGYATSMAANGDQAQAAHFLANPAFTLGPQLTEAKLERLPFLSTTNLATQRAVGAMGDGSGVQDGSIP